MAGPSRDSVSPQAVMGGDMWHAGPLLVTGASARAARLRCARPLYPGMRGRPAHNRNNRTSCRGLPVRMRPDCSWHCTGSAAHAHAQWRATGRGISGLLAKSDTRAVLSASYPARPFYYRYTIDSIIIVIMHHSVYRYTWNPQNVNSKFQSPVLADEV